jgi:hypothetical protein
LTAASQFFQAFCIRTLRYSFDIIVEAPAVDGVVFSRINQAVRYVTQFINMDGVQS